ncbi:alpha/beta hydrolase [Polaribacter sp. HL-MS24]|uniref:alpha/beta hydrolase family protein n=1 Tax=Polaribacter sp. HL-MS24 TaxID=3077735 RepID=UPI00293499CB|nr:alpha/beta hydrolase [Polaribacter sp. HL-MS24]WOC41164.1 alpha/beta hydrolase [Polaribacter sp. HL-MS24]
MKVVRNFCIEGVHKKPIVTDVFFKETQQPKKILIFCHGYKGFKDWGAWNLVAEAFANAGFFFIKFNFSHNGGTPEQPIDFPDLEAFGNNNYSKELDDLASVIDWISNASQFHQEAASNHISIIGHSRGGGIVTIKAAEDIRIQKVVSLAGVCNFSTRTATVGELETWKKTGVKYVVNGRTKQHMPHFYQFYEDFIRNKNRLNIERAAKNIHIPHLILHGALDSSIPIAQGEKIHSWNPKSIFKIIPNADHVFNVSHPWIAKHLSPELAQTVNDCVDFLKE